jgi:ElaB/YqjD/DUF883 family membrane-anchored ribosome-binding protein
MPKTTFTIPTEATRPLYAGVGVTDLLVGFVRDYVADVQKTVARIDRQPEVLREQATKVVAESLDALGKDAQSRRKAVEDRVAELQSEALDLPARLQKLLDENVSTAGDTYADLVKRGERLVGRIRRQQSTKATASSAKTTVAKAKTTNTQATKAAKSSTVTAKKTARKTAKKATAKRATAKKSPARSSAKATTTAAKKTASNAATAAVQGAEKVGN